jgi:ribosomal protein uS7
LAINAKEKYQQYLPHTAGRYNVKRFRKAQCPIVERLTNALMMHGRNNGKKLLAVKIVKHAFEIIHLLSGENPLQVLVSAIVNGMALIYSFFFSEFFSLVFVVLLEQAIAFLIHFFSPFR